MIIFCCLKTSKEVSNILRYRHILFFFSLLWKNKKGPHRGGSLRHVPPKDGSPYSLWAYGLDVMETGTSILLDGIRHQRRAVGLLQREHEERTDDTEEDS